MPIPEKEFQDEYKRIWARKTEVEHLIDELEKHNTYMCFILILGTIFSIVGTGLLYLVVCHFKEILELIN